MSYLYVWIGMSAGGVLYWGVRHGFHADQVDHATGPIWFGGVALLIHWLASKGTQ